MRDVIDLSAPRLSQLRLRSLLTAANDPWTRKVLARFLNDPWQIQGVAEYYAHDLDVEVDPVDVPRHLVYLRHAGWLHQSVAGLGLLSRLRRDDLTLRFPDVMASLREPAKLVGATGSRRVEARLQGLSSQWR